MPNCRWMILKLCLLLRFYQQAYSRMIVSITVYIYLIFTYTIYTYHIVHTDVVYAYDYIYFVKELQHRNRTYKKKSARREVFSANSSIY